VKIGAVEAGGGPEIKEKWKRPRSKAAMWMKSIM